MALSNTQNSELSTPSVISVARKPSERGVLLLIALFVLLLPLANPRVSATDEVQYYVYLRSLWFDGDLNFANDYQRFHELNPNAGINGSLLQPNRIRAATGLYGNIAPVGSAIMWTPFFLLADGLVRLANLFGANIPADGYSWPYIYAVCYASALYGLLGLLLSYRLARRYTSGFAATLASITIWLATPLVWYMFVQMPFAHATGLFLVALFITVWVEVWDRGHGIGGRGQKEEERRKKAENRTQHHFAVFLHPSSFILQSSIGHRQPVLWAILGLAGGLMVMVREQLGLMLLIPAVGALAQYWQMLRTGALRAAAALFGRHALFLAMFVLALTPQLAVYQVLNGVPRPAGEVSGKFNLCSPHMIDTLVDYDPRPSAWCHVVDDPTADFPPFAHGALVWSPVLLVALVGLGLLGRRDRLLFVAFTLAFVAQVYLNGAFGTTWHLSGAFGFRRLIECTPIFVVGLALLADRVPARWRWWLLVPALAFVAWNAGLVLNASLFNSETGLRTNGMQWPELWRWQLDVPRKVFAQATDIFFDRCRFLQNGC